MVIPASAKTTPVAGSPCTGTYSGGTTKGRATYAIRTHYGGARKTTVGISCEARPSSRSGTIRSRKIRSFFSGGQSVPFHLGRVDHARPAMWGCLAVVSAVIAALKGWALFG
jgi:hypothetical protein